MTLLKKRFEDFETLQIVFILLLMFDNIYNLTRSLKELRLQISDLVALQLQSEDLGAVDCSWYPQQRYVDAGHDAQISGRFRTGALCLKQAWWVAGVNV